jgi:hypothetical protein
MAWPQKDISLGVSSAARPKLDLNHCLSESTSEIRDIFVLQIVAAIFVILSNSSSDSVSRTLKLSSEPRRSSSFSGIGAFIKVWISDFFVIGLSYILKFKLNLKYKNFVSD